MAGPAWSIPGVLGFQSLPHGAAGLPGLAGVPRPPLHHPAFPGRRRSTPWRGRKSPTSTRPPGAWPHHEIASAHLSPLELGSLRIPRAWSHSPAEAPKGARATGLFGGGESARLGDRDTQEKEDGICSARRRGPWALWERKAGCLSSAHAADPSTRSSSFATNCASLASLFT